MRALLFALVLAVPADTYEQCRDRCAENMRKCYAEKCESIPTNEERSKCWMGCAASPEVHGCYEKCEAEKPPI